MPIKLQDLCPHTEEKVEFLFKNIFKNFVQNNSKNFNFSLQKLKLEFFEPFISVWPQCGSQVV